MAEAAALPASMSCNLPGGMDQFIQLFKTALDRGERDFFRSVVEVTWLKHQFASNGQMFTYAGSQGIAWERALSLVLRTHVTKTPRYFMASGAVTPVIVSYFRDFYPEFFTRSPFEDPEYYLNPFEDLSIEHLLLVHQVVFRVEMLQYALEHKLNYLEFLNWSTNYLMSYNDDVGKKEYALTQEKNSMYLFRRSSVIESGAERQARLSLIGMERGPQYIEYTDHPDFGMNTLKEVTIYEGLFPPKNSTIPVADPAVKEKKARGRPKKGAKEALDPLAGRNVRFIDLIK